MNAPAPRTVSPAEPLLEFAAFLDEASLDLGEQATAPHDENEVLRKLDGIEARLRETRARYKALLSAGARLPVSDTLANLYQRVADVGRERGYSDETIEQAQAAANEMRGAR